MSQRFVYCKTHGRQTEKKAAKNKGCPTCDSFVKKPFKAKRPGES